MKIKLYASISLELDSNFKIAAIGFGIFRDRRDLLTFADWSHGADQKDVTSIGHSASCCIQVVNKGRRSAFSSIGYREGRSLPLTLGTANVCPLFFPRLRLRQITSLVQCRRLCRPRKGKNRDKVESRVCSTCRLY